MPTSEKRISNQDQTHLSPSGHHNSVMVSNTDEKISESKEPPEKDGVLQSPPAVIIKGDDKLRHDSDETGGTLVATSHNESSGRDSPHSTPNGEVDLESGEGSELKRTPSTVIPRNKRRGLFAQLVIGIPEIDDPVQYSRGIKNFIVFIIACAAIAGPMGFESTLYIIDNSSAIYLPALPHVAEGLHTNTTLTNLTVAFYMLALGLFPLWWSAASERMGRRSIYVISFALWIIFNVLCATSQNIIELIIMRILAAGAGASVQAVGAGTLADIYVPQQRGTAMGWFYIGPLTGPLIVFFLWWQKVDGRRRLLAGLSMSGLDGVPRFGFLYSAGRCNFFSFFSFCPRPCVRLAKS